MTGIPPLGRLLRRARLTPADLLATIEATWSSQTSEFFNVEQLVAVALGEETCGLGLLRLWVAACGGSDIDEVEAWVSQGWTAADARSLVRRLPPRSPIRVVRANGVHGTAA